MNKTIPVLGYTVGGLVVLVVVIIGVVSAWYRFAPSTVVTKLEGGA